KAVAKQKIWMGHGGVENRRRVGQASRLQENTSKLAAAVIKIAQEGFQRIDEGAAHRGAEAAGVQHHHVVVDIFDQEVIERYLAKFVDDDGRIRKSGILQ